MLDKRLESASHLQDTDVVRGDALMLSGIRHAFFTRNGGVSTGLYTALNAGIGSQDEPDAVRENRSRAMRFLRLGEEALATAWQVHSNDAVVTAAPFGAERPKADAVVTSRPGLAVGVVTADCGPVLFADRAAGVVAAAHAGWRGALGGVLEATISAMESCGATRKGIVAVLGPTITQPNYEIGADMADAIIAGDPAQARFLAPGATPGKQQFDLPGFIVERLSRAGVSAGFVGRCTYGEPDTFFSFRRTTHRGEADYGRQLSAISIET